MAKKKPATNKKKTSAKSAKKKTTASSNKNQQELSFTKSPALPQPEPRTALVYLLPEQIELAQNLAAAANLKFIAAAAPSTGSTANVADALKAERCLDFRQQILSLNPDLFLILTVDEVDTAELALLSNHPTNANTAVLTLEPLAASIADCSPKDEINPTQPNVHTPLFRATPMMTVFNDIRESFGTVRSVNVAIRAHRTLGSLYARLTDAVDIMEYLCGTAELVDAAMSGPLGEPPATLRALHGHLTINARFAENCCGCIHVSDLGATWARGVTILGDAGCVRLNDQNFEWWDQDGKLVDSSTSSTSASAQDLLTPESIIVTEINRALAQSTATTTTTIASNSADTPSPASTPMPTPAPTPAVVSRIIPQSKPTRTIAVCEAIRLSLHTGQSESPRKILELFELAH